MAVVSAMNSFTEKQCALHKYVSQYIFDMSHNNKFVVP